MKKTMGVFLLVGVLVGTVAAMQQGGQQAQPEMWEYKTIPFKVEIGDSVEKNTRLFDTTLNREAEAGWQYAGPCCHMGTDHFGINYVVLKRQIFLR